MVRRSKRLRLPLLALSTAVLAAPIAAQPAKQVSDLIITGGTIYDGSAATPIVGDIAITGDRIVYVGPTAKNPYAGKRIVSAKGMVVAPGFIDPHTHADAFVPVRGATTGLVVSVIVREVVPESGPHVLLDLL